MNHNAEYYQAYAKHLLENLLKNAQYGIEHMTSTHWAIVSGISVLLGFLLLRSR